MKQVLLTLALAVAIVALWLRATSVPAITQPVGASSPASFSAAPVVISMLYSPAKQAWVEWARDQYVRERPDVEVKLTAMGSIEAIDAILLGKVKPVVWSPESMLELDTVAELWQKQEGHAFYGSDAKLAPESLVRTSLVLLTWESRARVLDEYLRKQAGQRPRLWESLVEGSASSDGWKRLGGPAEWGAVKLAYPDPQRTAAGFWALYLACLDEFDGALQLSAEQVDDPAVAALLRAAASVVSPPAASARDMVTRMEQFGPRRYDFAVTYEALALEAIRIPKERWERLVIYYPPRLVWIDHPAVVLDLAETSAEQKEAGLQWIGYLKSPAAQVKAMSFGFRSAAGATALSSGRDLDRPSTPGAERWVPIPLSTRQRLETEAALPAPKGRVVEKLIATLRASNPED
jgi:extracellular solute-binding protein